VRKGKDAPAAPEPRQYATVKCELSVARKLELEAQLLDATIQVERFKELKAGIVAEQNEQIKRHDARRKEAAGVLHAEFEMLRVPIRVVKNYQLRKLQTIREDTGAVIGERDMPAPTVDGGREHEAPEPSASRSAAGRWGASAARSRRSTGWRGGARRGASRRKSAGSGSTASCCSPRPRCLES